MDLRTRSRGKPHSKRALREESDLDEEDEERLVPVVSGENKRKRAPRGGSNVRRVKMKTLSYEGGSDRGEGSDEDEDSKVESLETPDATPREADNLVEKRQSSRVKIKTFKLRENAESEPKVNRGGSKGGGVQKKGDEEDVGKKVAEAPQRPLKVHITLSDGKQKPGMNSSSATDLKPAPQQQQQQQPQQKPKVSSAANSNPPQSSPQKAAAPAETQDDINQAELDTSLKVIRKLMKMDAAHPFNRPVDPIGQGVPDYLDIIDTPMDFGTICQTLERKQKYKNALDVYKDIQQIWNNCRKYNHKGDPILELMKKVQKACSKYWTASGVLRDPKKPLSKKGEIQAPEPPSDGGTSASGHKANCNCVVCVAVRRRSAKEKRAVGLGSARAVKRQISKLKGKQELNEAEMEELMQLDEAYTEQMEEADHFFPASYQVPLRPLNPVVLSLGQALFGCRSQLKKPNSMANALLPLVSSYKPI